MALGGYTMDYPGRRAMPKVTVYDAQGNPHSVDPVDAREYVASGSYTMQNPKADPGEVSAIAPETAQADAAVRDAAIRARDTGESAAKTASRKK